MGKISVVPIIVSGVAIILALAGCSSPAAPASSGPSASPAAELSSAPASRFDVTCADLVLNAELDALFGANSYEPRSDWAPSVSPVTYAVQNTGGLSCTWGNDDAPVGGIPNPAYDELTVQVLPDATAAQIELHVGDHPLDDAQPFGDSSGTTCFANARLCTSNIVVGEAWIDVFLQGVNVADPASDADVLALTSPLLSAVAARISAAAASNTTPAVAPVAARTDCQTILPAATVQSVFQTAELPVHSTYHSGGWGVMTGAATLAGVTRCIVGPAGSDAALANLELLPHGAWAFEPAQVQSAVWKNHETVSVAGVTEPAYLLCPIGTVSACAVDFVVGDDWVRLGTFINGQRPVADADRGQVLELAGLVASALE
ncbi:hypothetical protein [Cryobacterium serini]|uniref:DUF3558 domain-containing protein n=1 Tax=Cryobacterium serini TaxID=1259201 RepID=A0A4R9BQD0_9MICO|nr:hypothetical protein [Cryobacterium serini]TFD88963.1 hypothetical protein E3T51_06455 [Cryobacterium serini]